MTACPSCGTENPSGNRFCGSCGSPLAADERASREERKVVTVLFCDIVGSTERAEQMDPEDVRAVLARYHEHVRGELERHGGTVEKFIGDAVMALFGAPVAHEDDPERAVLAALAIRRWATDATDLQVRVGITTGEALVSIGARPERGEAMAAGDVVNTAARLQSAAPVDAILVDAPTYRATRDVVEYREVDPVTAKGKQEPIPAWEATGTHSRLGLDVGETTATPLVGRSRDLELLLQRFERTRRERVVELITLVGEPGIGKSRLVLELFRRIDADAELVRWRQGRSLPYGDGVALWALAEIVKAEAGIMETDSASDAETKLVRAVAATVPEDEAGWVESHLRPLVGLAGEATITGEHRDEAFAAWRRFLESVADEHPLVLVFEDLHWADDTLIDFVDHLVDWATDVPMLVVVMARPEFLARRPGWGGGKLNAMTHSLPHLNDEETASLVHALLGRTVMDADAQRSLIGNAGGNPLYAEEFARMLEERGAAPADSRLPESVQGIIAARLDGLDPSDKALLQDAAVLGKVFWLGAVSRLAGNPPDVERRLHELERRELIRRDRASAVAGERQYAFRHVLVRDVAYGQIPRAQRAEKHAAAATWIEQLASERSDDRAEMLAHHWSQAMRYAEAAGHDAAPYRERASAALLDAGDRAMSLNAVSAAASMYEGALELVGAHAPAPVLLRFARSLYLAGDERAEEILERARGALAVAGDTAAEAFAESMLSHVAWLRGDTEASTSRVERAVALVGEAPPSDMKAYVLARAAARAQVAGRDEEATRLAGEAVDVARTLGLGEVEIHAMTTRGSARMALEDMDGLADLERAYELGVERNSPEASRTALNLGVSTFLLGDIARYRELHTEGLRIGRRFGLGPMVRFAEGSLASLSYFEGDWDRAMAEADAFLAASAGEPHYQNVHDRSIRAAILFARDDVPAALAEIEAAFHGASDPQSRGPALAVASRIFCELGDARAVDTAMEVIAIDFGTTSEPMSSALLALTDLPDAVHERLRDAVSRERIGDSRWMAAARAALDGRFAEAAEIYAGMPFMPGEAEARFRASEQLFAEGRMEEAEVQLSAAIARWRSVGATRYLARAEMLRGDATNVH